MEQQTINDEKWRRSDLADIKKESKTFFTTGKFYRKKKHFSLNIIKRRLHGVPVIAGAAQSFNLFWKKIRICTALDNIECHFSNIIAPDESFFCTWLPRMNFCKFRYPMNNMASGITVYTTCIANSSLRVFDIWCK